MGSKDGAATIDNSATTTQLEFLGRVISAQPDPGLQTAFERGLDYLFKAQYENGGWPQFFPLRKGYSSHITYNDGAMIHVLSLLREVRDGKPPYTFVDQARRGRTAQAISNGVNCILRTQIRQGGKLTAWCAQHDETTLQPAKARSYELPSLSGGESPGIVLFLMSLENPSPEIVNAIQSAVAWFDKAKIRGIRIEGFVNSDGLKDRKVVADKDAPPMWARFYELEDNRPFFCDRDGIKKYSLAEIGRERRNGYSWYGNGPQKVLDAYKKWQPKWAP